jgi:hypothetical protein
VTLLPSDWWGLAFCALMALLIVLACRGDDDHWP